MVDARQFLGMEQIAEDRWQLRVTPEVATPGNFLFGGCGLGAALVALEEAAGRPTIWATAQYLSYAPTGSTVEFRAHLAAVGKHVTQGRVVATLGDNEILTVNAACGLPGAPAGDTWVQPPKVPGPEACPPRVLPPAFTNSILDRIDIRVAKGTSLEDIDGTPGDPDVALWARVPGHLGPSAATLAIFGDYVSGNTSQPLGMRTMSRSLDNTLRVGRLVPAEWVLCDIRIHALVDGYAQGIGFLWAPDGTLLATASQSMSVRLWPTDLPEDFLRTPRGAP